MRNINETFEDIEYFYLVKKKGEKTWRAFILKNAGYKEEKGGIKTNG